MNNKKTVAHLRKWASEATHPIFNWPTDACGYDQHMRFVSHRNKNWQGGSEAEFNAFVLAYADSLEAAPSESADE